MATFTIGQLASRCQVNVETIRYYHRRELLAEPPRLPSGHRIYDQESAARIGFIKRAQSLGFSLDEIKELLEMRSGDAACEQVCRQAEAKLAQIDEKIAALQSIQEALKTLVSQCREDGPQGHCSLLGAMEDPAMTSNIPFKST